MPAFAPAQATASGRDGRILLVDRDDSVLEAVGTILRERDHRVRTARSTEEAGALLEKEDFDLIVADMEISSGDADHLEHWLSQHKPALHRKVIWMSAVRPGRSAEKGNAGGGRYVLRKPFKANELLAAVDEILLSNVGAAPIER
jgi:DNA-binding response OmpR family regulator